MVLYQTNSPFACFIYCPVKLPVVRSGYDYGVAVGLFLAEGAADQTPFCEGAATRRDEVQYHYWQ
jgi:hypothetical protein